MHLSFLIAVAIVSFIAFVGASGPNEFLSSFSNDTDIQEAATTNSKFLRTSHTSAATGERAGSGAHIESGANVRFLQTGHSSHEHGEEGAGGLFVPMTEKLKAVIMRWDAKPKIIKRWLQKEKNPVWEFHRMDLENAGDDLFEKKQFKKWVD
ncbi:hypothetical protein L916_12822 [Phytophthora nicotianae]|uniref:RxLR effector protein n=1 Tax=Phytophthora nicotianae TaxID=4792 RepID=W2IN99_PHYNI|nr:hypothetical protein L916_12822 [Phytophthora nicotianae]